MDILLDMNAALSEAEVTLKDASATFIRAEAEQRIAQGEFDRIQAAVHAMNGTQAPVIEVAPGLIISPEVKPELSNTPEVKPAPKAGTTMSDVSEGKANAKPGQTLVTAHEANPDMDFSDIEPAEQYNKPVNDPNNPWGAFKCSGCGRYNTVRPVIMNRKGKQVMTNQCFKCGNEIY